MRQIRLLAVSRSVLDANTALEHLYMFLFLSSSLSTLPPLLSLPNHLTCTLLGSTAGGGCVINLVMLCVLRLLAYLLAYRPKDAASPAWTSHPSESQVTRRRSAELHRLWKL